MEVFKKMLACMLLLVEMAEAYHKTDGNPMAYILRGEVSYLRSVIEDVERRMNKDHGPYKEAS